MARVQRARRLASAVEPCVFVRDTRRLPLAVEVCAVHLLTTQELGALWLVSRAARALVIAALRTCATLRLDAPLVDDRMEMKEALAGWACVLEAAQQHGSRLRMLELVAESESGGALTRTTITARLQLTALQLLRRNSGHFERLDTSGVDCTPVMLAALARCPVLRTLNSNLAATDPLPKRAISALLRGCPCLTSLTLHGEEGDDEMDAVLWQALDLGLPLRELELTFERPTPQPGHWARLAAPVHRGLERLELYLHDKPRELPDKLVALGRALLQLPRLTDLTVRLDRVNVDEDEWDEQDEKDYTELWPADAVTMVVWQLPRLLRKLEIEDETAGLLRIQPPASCALEEAMCWLASRHQARAMLGALAADCPRLRSLRVSAPDVEVEELELEQGVWIGLETALRNRAPGFAGLETCRLALTLPVSVIAALAALPTLPALSALSALSWLDVSTHGFPSTTLARELLAALPRLRHLALRSFRWGSRAGSVLQPSNSGNGDGVCAAHLETLRLEVADDQTFVGLSCPRLGSLSLRGPGIRVVRLAEALARMPRLTSLELAGIDDVRAGPLVPPSQRRTAKGPPIWLEWIQWLHLRGSRDADLSSDVADLCAALASRLAALVVTCDEVALPALAIQVAALRLPRLKRLQLRGPSNVQVPSLETSVFAALLDRHGFPTLERVDLPPLSELPPESPKHTRLRALLGRLGSGQRPVLRLGTETLEPLAP